MKVIGGAKLNNRGRFGLAQGLSCQYMSVVAP